MKREKTAEPNIYIGHDGTLYYRKGSIERSLKTKSLREAVRRKRGIEAKADTFGTQAFSLSPNDVIKDFLDERYREVQSGQLRMSSYMEFEDMFRVHLLDFFGSKRFADIDERLWDEYVFKKRNLDLSNHRKVFAYFLAWAKRKQFYRYVPDFKIPPPQRRQRKILSPETCSLIISNSHGSLRLFVLFYLLMGMRRSEIIKLHWRRVDLSIGHLILLPEDTKTKRFRSLPINQHVLELLKVRRDHQEARGETNWVFPNAKDPKRHASVSGLKTAWRTCLKRSLLEGADIQWHDLRATHQYYAHKRIDFTDAQREKFSGSSVDVQKSVYVSFGAEDVRGLERVVQYDGLDQLLERVVGEDTGKTKLLKGKKI